MTFILAIFLSIFAASKAYSMHKFMKAIISIICLFLCISSAYAQGNIVIDSFSKAKRTLESSVYYDHRVTLYCGASFDAENNIIPLEGFISEKHIKRSKRVEWEHVVPAENFGRTFVEWSVGGPQCVDKWNKPYKGRKCANKANMEYRYIQSDLYNLYPAIGSVNAMRSNYDFQMLPSVEYEFGICEFKIDNQKAEPPAYARGRIARTYQYMEKTYSRYKMSEELRQLMDKWDEMYPVDAWECTRAKRIERIQGNKNLIVDQACQSAGL